MMRAMACASMACQLQLAMRVFPSCTSHPCIAPCVPSCLGCSASNAMPLPPQILMLRSRVLCGMLADLGPQVWSKCAAPHSSFSKCWCAVHVTPQYGHRRCLHPPCHAPFKPLKPQLAH